MNRTEMAKLIKVVDHGWPHSKLTVETAALYTTGLADLPYAAAERAVQNFLLSSEFRPSVAAIRKAVMAQAGILPPPLPEAVVQAEAWLRYQDSLSYVNGSGWTPTAPSVHPAVVRACGAVSGGGNWEYGFTRAYRALSEEAEGGVLSASYSQAVAALGSGS